MHIVLVNPCRPFANMARKNDFLEILKTALAQGFELNAMGECIIDEAIHHAFALRRDVIMKDILGEVMQLQEKYPNGACFELCSRMNCMVDPSYGEYAIFCERDGVAVNQLEVEGLKMLYGQASNPAVRDFIAVLIIHSLLF